MTRRRGRTFDSAREIAAEVFCLGPRGRTQTNVYFVHSAPSWVMIDAGWESDAPAIDRAARSLLGADSPPTAILLTHCHPDHDGSALRLAGTWGCPVYMHPAELPIAIGDFEAADWECIPTPGHTPGHVSFFRRRDRVAITGDALVTLKLNSWTGLALQRPGLSEPPWYTTWDRRAARDSVERLVELEPTVLAGGHGFPMAGTDTARALRALMDEDISH